MVLSSDPLVYYVDDFTTDEECDAMIAKSSPQMKVRHLPLISLLLSLTFSSNFLAFPSRLPSSAPSQRARVSGMQDGRVSSGRTNSVAWMAAAGDAIFEQVPISQLFS